MRIILVGQTTNYTLWMKNLVKVLCILPLTGCQSVAGELAGQAVFAALGPKWTSNFDTIYVASKSMLLLKRIAKSASQNFLRKSCAAVLTWVRKASVVQELTVFRWAI